MKNLDKVSEDLNEEILEFAIGALASEVYDLNLKMVVQAEICKLLPTLLQKYIQKTTKINKVRI